ncbi:hypothetical protein IFM58399_08760 [Aspergillus lentulus]|uniref:DUF3824 domain-containing protein n=1 Tax=Aspergillus lentulus TaxID=293939 RepID=A0ABQ1A3A9_ASPLE|nr:uncharacterized protein IFM58399_08760 [Aspergillus lentulus]GFF50253.1 hypothetical protein IFM58399_08760 [Aspergillus lentulus]GFF53042.1 hypothetical protein IFM62136_02209 [Aspergillus lentulus]GFF72531.1 hypothetical protein IFM60648_03705 [Aspergillus lentulus]GFF77492.1 hypothetical protein IFM47457_04420 [Aspergillus lentulus]GFG08132.1 hypothetical protein IFM61392_05210 [Aspergillus lentulus]
MAYYDDRHYHPARDRYPRPGPPSYEENPYYYGDPRSRAPTDLVRRRDGSSESLDDVPRHYPPSDYGYEYGYGYPPNSRRSRGGTGQEGVRRSHSLNGRRGGYYEDSDYSYRPRHEHRSRHEGDRRDRHKYSRSPSSSRSPHRRRRKSFSEQALGALGLGAAASSSASRHRDHSRGRSHGHNGRSHSYSPSRSRSRDRHRRGISEQRMAQAARAALTAAAVEAFRVRKEPGEWAGEKGKRVLTAAITAAGTDGLVDRDPNKHSKRHIVESTLAGLAANHFVNGPRSKSRSKSRGRGSDSKLKNLAATGALAAVGKEAYERFKSRSRSRHRGRSSSRDSYDDSDSPRRHRSRKRSKSVSDYINQGMEALGLGDKDKDRDDRRGRHRGRPSRYDDYSDSDRDSEPGARRARHSRDVGRPRSVYATQRPSSAITTTSGARASRADDDGFHHSTSDSESSSDLGDSSDEKKKRKKLNHQALMTAGLATIATIHAAHGLHQNMEKRKQRMKMVKEGEMSPEEARRRRIKANLADAASIGLSALGIKGAIAEWKEADEKRKERAEFKKKCEEHRQKRQQRTRSKSQSAAGPPPPSWRTVYPDEIEENASSSGYLRSHAGKVRSPSVGADMRYRSSYWS